MTNIATMIRMNGSASGSPCCGSQLATPSSLMISDWSMPIPRPTAAAIANDWKRAISTAASAGTMYSV